MPKTDPLIPPAPAPEWSREGDDFTFRWPTLGVVAVVEDVQERSEGWYCEVTFSGLGAQLAWTKLKLDATERRTALVTKLRDRYPLDEQGNGVAWDDILEQLCFITVRESKRGEPVLDLADVQAPIELPFLIRPVLPEGLVSVVFGDGDTGKSYLAMFWAVSARTGIPLPGGFRPTRQVNVLIADYETQATLPARRLRRVCAGLGFKDVPRGIHYRRFLRSIPDDYRLLRRAIAQHGIGLLIVDSLAAACGGDPKDPRAAIETLTKLGALGITVLVIAHITKADAQKDNGVATIFGSQFFRNYARATWELTKLQQVSKDIKALGLFNRKMNEDEPRPDMAFRYEFTPMGGPVRLSGYATPPPALTAKYGSVQDQICAVMSDGGEWSAYEIAAELGLEAKEGGKNVAAYLRHLAGSRAERTDEKAKPGPGRVVRWRLLPSDDGKAKGETPYTNTEVSPFYGAMNGPSEDERAKEEKRRNVSPLLRASGDGSPRTPLRGRETETAALRVPRPPQDEYAELDDAPF